MLRQRECQVVDQRALLSPLQEGLSNSVVEGKQREQGERETDGEEELKYGVLVEWRSTLAGADLALSKGGLYEQLPPEVVSSSDARGLRP